jgi:hypothetical protein
VFYISVLISAVGAIHFCKIRTRVQVPIITGVIVCLVVLIESHMLLLVPENHFQFWCGSDLAVRHCPLKHVTLNGILY